LEARKHVGLAYVPGWAKLAHFRRLGVILGRQIIHHRDPLQFLLISLRKFRIISLVALLREAAPGIGIIRVHIEDLTLHVRRVEVRVICLVGAKSGRILAEVRNHTFGI
jgi:hypothetical protein